MKREGLQQVFCYQDAQTDDRLLTQAVIQSARSLGAQALTSARLLKAKHVGGGYNLHCLWLAAEHEVFSRVVINAGGPWANHINAQVSPTPPTADVDLVQGTHLILAGQLSEHCFYLEAPQDQRAVFVMPWHGNTLLGTTETLYEGDPDEVEPLASEQHYQIETGFSHSAHCRC